MQRPETLKLLNGGAEQLIYWFFDDETLAEDQYKATLLQIAKETPFTLVLHTPRSPKLENLEDEDQVRALSNAAEYAHSLGLGFGIEVLPESRRPTNTEDMQGVIVDTVIGVSPSGSTEVKVCLKDGVVYTCLSRTARPVKTEILAAYMYRPIDQFHYEQGTLVDVTPAVELRSDSASEFLLRYEAKSDMSDHLLHVQTLTYYDYPSLFGTFASDTVRRVLMAYKSANLDGSVLDELGIYPCRPDMVKGKDDWREQWYSQDLDSMYQRRSGRTLKKDLLHTRVVPQGRDGLRTRIISDYFDTIREGIVELENSFYGTVKEIFGDDAFVAAHSTWHNGDAEDVWHDGLSWWSARRDYGQTDEALVAAVGLALSRKWGGRLWYDMYYDSDKGRFLDHVVSTARVGGRIHYHALNDCSPSGNPFRDAGFLRDVRAIEGKIRLLNWYQTRLPQAEILIVTGYREMVVKDEPETRYDLNSRFTAGFELARTLFGLGYTCDLVPSYEIDEGNLRLCCSGGIHYGISGSYKLMIYVLPNYSTEKTLDLLRTMANEGRNLVIAGALRRDLDGSDLSDLYGHLRVHSVAAFSEPYLTETDLALLTSVFDSLSIHPSRIDQGWMFGSDEAVVVQRAEDLLSASDQEVEVNLGGTDISVTFSGVLGVKANNGSIERLAASGLRRVAVDGVTKLSFSNPKDTLWRAGEDGVLLVHPEESMIPRVVHL